MPLVKCPHCDSEHEAGTKFCPKSGKSIGAAAKTMFMFRAADGASAGASATPPPPPARKSTPSTSAVPIPITGSGSSSGKVSRPVRHTPIPSAPLKEVPPPPVAADRVPRPPVAPGLENSGVVRTTITGEHSATSGSRSSGVRSSGAGVTGSGATVTSNGPHRSPSLPSWVAAPEAGGTNRLPTTMFPAVEAPPRATLDLLKDALALYNQHAQVFLLTAAVLYVPGAILGALFRISIPAPSSPGVGFRELLIQGVLMALVGGVVTPLTNGALTLAAADRLLGGTGRVREYWSWLGGRLRPLLSAILPAALLCLVGSLLFVLPGLALSFLLLFVPMVVLVERQSGISALRRSFELVKSDWRRVGLLFVLFLAATIIPGLLVALLPSALLRATVGVLISLALVPLAALTLLLLYLDNRRTAEGFDKEALRAQLDAVRSS